MKLTEILDDVSMVEIPAKALSGLGFHVEMYPRPGQDSGLIRVINVTDGKPLGFTINGSHCRTANVLIHVYRDVSAPFQFDLDLKVRGYHLSQISLHTFNEVVTVLKELRSNPEDALQKYFPDALQNGHILFPP